MATRSCPQCGAQYVATVRRCIDCDVMLVDDAGPVADGEAAGSSASPMGSGDEVGYELEGWGNQLKVTLEGMLVRAEIGRVWEAGALVVSAADEDAVDDLIATLEGDDLPELRDDTPMVALEIEGLDVDGHAELDARLLAGSVAHAWDDEGALVVAEADEGLVLALIEEVLDGPAVEGDGLTAQDALSALYVAVDRLVKHPHDRKPATAYVAANDALDGLPVPYGFAASDWDDLLAEVDQLAIAVRPHADTEKLAAAGDGPVDRDDEPVADTAEGDDEIDVAVADVAHAEQADAEQADAEEAGRTEDAEAQQGRDDESDAGTTEVAAGHVDSEEADTGGALSRDRAAAQALRARLSDLV